ncbi:MAG: acyltransferase [Muribaculaceae bacterium]|nr:acyltransferase [Muribaculaceae bacterium]
MATKQRIAYIDFMKGFCILLVVAFHIDYTIFSTPYNFMLQQFRVPMYFFLSGLFFKEYNGFFDFSRRKINNIVIPLLFFTLIGVIFNLCCNLFKHNMDFRMALSMFPRNPINANTPIWFLVVLFEINIIYYLLQKFLPRWLTIIAAIILSIVGYVVVQHCDNISIFLYLDIAFVAMPFFILGSESRRLGLLERGPHKAVRIAMVLVTAVLLYFFAGEINMYERRYPSYLSLYIFPAISILTLLFVSQYIKRPVPIISHIGRYSIIVLGTQILLIYPLKYAVIKFFPSINTMWHYLIILVSVVILEYPVIYLLRKYLPRFTAQEEFFHEGWKIKK